MKKTSASNRFKIRFDLEQKPTDIQVNQVAKMVKRRIGPEYLADQARAAAAKRVFPNLRTHIYYSEADTVVGLLGLLGGKRAGKRACKGIAKRVGKSTRRRIVRTIRNNSNK